jgi:hypothetical protein
MKPLSRLSFITGRNSNNTASIYEDALGTPPYFIYKKVFEQV